MSKRAKIFILVVFATLFSCRMGTVDYKKELGATVKFHHREHKNFIEKHGCIPCHAMNVKMEWASIEAAERESKKLLMPSKVTCHYCHNNPEKTPAPDAPTKCYICHLNMREIEPQNHKVADWLKKHSLTFYTSSKDCKDCHKESFCIDCHLRRDVIENLVHPRNYEKLHGIEVSANPAKCSKCHHLSFCMECHTKRTWR